MFCVLLRSPFHSDFNDISVFSPFSHQVGILTGTGTDKERKIRKSNNLSLKWLNLWNISLHQQSTLFTLCFWLQIAKLTSVITSTSCCASPSRPCSTYVQTILVDFSQGLRVHSTNTWTFDLLVTDKAKNLTGGWNSSLFQLMLAGRVVLAPWRLWTLFWTYCLVP